MTKLIVGVDISKSTFDVAIPIENVTKPRHVKYTNDKTGFKQFVSDIPELSHVVMEASGPYYLQLATYLYQSGYDVSIINPLSMSHFTKMRMHRCKTDKKDAGYIAEYGISEQSKLRLWKPKPDYILELQQLEGLIENFTTQRARLKNMNEAFTSSGSNCKKPLRTLNKEIKHLTSLIVELESRMLELIETYHKEMFAQLISIPGLGKRSAMMLIVITEAFTKFENSKQLAAFIGIDPRTFESGTSVKAKPRIRKMGMSRMRQLLYLCGLRAMRCNKACADLYARLKSKGKNGKQGIVAIAHKLLRQAFAIAKSQNYYEEKLVF